MFATLFLALPLAVIWMIVTASISLGSFLVGTILGLAIVVLLRTEKTTIQWRRLPDQMIALIIYTVTLGRDVVMCSIDVTRRVLCREMPLNPGIIAVATQDMYEDDVTAAFSAHGITLTPGELVLDFDGARTMYVHCLDVAASSQSAPDAQTKRLLLLRRIQGKQ